jgi:predicted alpha/beta-hydrolase family hydrolase
MATHVAAADAALPIDGLVLLAYPFHPPGKPEKRRDAHLPLVRRPMLVVQGTRDTFGGPDEIGPVFAALEPPAEIYAVDGGDHSFKVARAGREGQAAIDDAIRAHVAAWMQRIVAASRA